MKPRLIPQYSYRMGGMLWKRWLGAGRLGTIHNESFQLERITPPQWHRWRLTRRGTREVWQGATLLGLIGQVFLDLHCEQFDVEDLRQTDGPGESCRACQIETPVMWGSHA